MNVSGKIHIIALLTLLLVSLPGQGEGQGEDQRQANAGYEYVIFKRVTEDLGIETLPFKYTVWHIDALNKVKYEIERLASEIVAEERVAFMEREIKKIDPGVFEALVLMGWSGTEKMINYGLTTTPAAVLLDKDKKVVMKWDGITDGNVLYLAENRP